MTDTTEHDLIVDNFVEHLDELAQRLFRLDAENIARTYREYAVQIPENAGEDIEGISNHLEVELPVYLTKALSDALEHVAAHERLLYLTLDDTQLASFRERMRERLRQG